MIGLLKAAVDAGIKVIIVDSYIGDGDYANGPVKFPITYIGSNNTEGGRIAARGLAKAIGGKGTVYINSTNPNVSSVEDREKGFKEAMTKDFPNIKVLGPDYNLDDPNKATQQTAAVLAREPDLAGVFGTNVFSAQGAGAAVVNAGLGGHVQVSLTTPPNRRSNYGPARCRRCCAKPFDWAMAVPPQPTPPASRASRRVETAFAIIDKQRERPGNRPLHLPVPAKTLRLRFFSAKPVERCVLAARGRRACPARLGLAGALRRGPCF